MNKVLSDDPTLLGEVGAVTGGTVSVEMLGVVASGIAIIGGNAYRVGQVGSFVKIPQGYQNLYGIVSEVGAAAVPEAIMKERGLTGRWLTVQLVGETVGSAYEKGVSQHPNVGDPVHAVTEENLRTIYGQSGLGYVSVGRLSSAENIEVRISLDKLVTRHCAVLGSTGSGKSTLVSNLIQTIVRKSGERADYPAARILMLDIHGEYGRPLKGVAEVFRIDPNIDEGEKILSVPYWALEADDILDFGMGNLSDNQRIAVYDAILELKASVLEKTGFIGVTDQTLTVDTPIPYSLKKLWYKLIHFETRTFRDSQRTEAALLNEGDPEDLVPPNYDPPTTLNTAPFLNQRAHGIRRQLGTMRSRLLDHKYDFLLHPGVWEPNLEGETQKDLDELLAEWLGHERPVTVLDLSDVPSDVLNRLIGAILNIIYESLFWSRRKIEGGVKRPLLIVLEEAHRYLSATSQDVAQRVVRRIVKEGRKYGIGAMVISQRPSEIDETILSQCGTYIALRLSNQTDRSRVRSTLAENLSGIVEMLPVLRTGEAIITGEAAQLPIRCRSYLPQETRRPDSVDPRIAERWKTDRSPEDYRQVVASWRGKTTEDFDFSD